MPCSDEVTVDSIVELCLTEQEYVPAKGLDSWAAAAHGVLRHTACCTARQHMLRLRTSDEVQHHIAQEFNTEAAG
jgi:hypothetical protein